MSAKKSFLIYSLIMLIMSIYGTAEVKSLYADGEILSRDGKPATVNNKFHPNKRPSDIPKTSWSHPMPAPNATNISRLPHESLNGASTLVYDSGNGNIQEAMNILGISFELRTSSDPVTTEDLYTHDILVVGWNDGGDMSGLDPDILAIGIKGRILLTGHDADYHTVYGPAAAETFLAQAIDYVLDGSGTGLVALGDYVTAFSYLPDEWGILVIGGQIGDIITSFTTEGLASGVFDGLTPEDMSNWGNSYHAIFTAWGAEFVSFELGGTGEDVVTIAKARRCPSILEKIDDIKWSQPPVEVNEGIIDGWDEVSVLDANCWDCPTQCHGDADCDGYVGPADSNILVAAFGTSQGDPNYNPCADFDRDGDVDTADQNILLSWWGTNPPSNCPSARAIVADDWVCMDDKPIKGIHWWGSFKGWTEPNQVPPNEMPSAFHIGIWTDVPDPDPCDPNTFSHPNELIWENICDCYVWSFAGYDMDPRGEGENDACFKFDQLLSQDKWFYQDPEGPQYELTGGICDDFNLPTEDASPSQAMVNYWPTFLSRDFDETGINNLFGHTFTNLPSNIVAAELKITMQPDATSCDPNNDLLALEFTGNLPAFLPVVWYYDIKNLPLVPNGTPIGRWENGDEPNIFTLDLGNLPPHPHFPGVTSVLKHLADGELDVMVHDDTAVDCITLSVECASVYWLSIVAIYDGNTPEHPWGWKTRPHFCKDDAVRITGLVGQWPPIIGSVWEGGEPIEYPSGTSWDMAFVLTTNRKYTPRKWHWPDDESSSLDLYQDGIINFKDLANMAEHWLEQAESYPCDGGC